MQPSSPPPRSFDPANLNAAWVRALAAKLVDDEHAAEDLAQDARLAAWRSAPEDEPASRNWIAAVLSRLARKRARDLANRRVKERGAARNEAVDAADDVIGRVEVHAALVAAVLALEEPYRATLLLRYFDELSPSAIAARQRVPVRTVKTRLARGLDRLRERLDREHHGDRSSWLAALTPLAHSVSFTPLTLGALLVKSKLAAAIGVVLALGGVAWFATRSSGGEPRPEFAPESVVASSAPVEALSPPPSTQLVARTSEAQQDAQPTATPLPDPARDLHGLVTDSRGTPVMAARVTAFRSPRSALGFVPQPPDPRQTPAAATASDSEGRFHLDLEPGCRFDLCVEHPSFARYDSGLRNAGENVVVVLTRPSDIHGRITREGDGKPATGAIVRAGLLRVDRSWRRVEADQHGEYEIDGLPQGDYHMIVDCSDAVSGRSGPFRISEGESVQRDLVLLRGVIARGIVTDARTGSPIQGVIVSESLNAAPKDASTDASGAYELRGVDTNGPIRLFARTPGYALGVGFGTAATAELTIDFALEKGLRAHGRVLDPADNPLADVEVSAFGNDLVSTRTAADGSFELAGLRRDGSHDLRLLKQGFGGKAYAFPENEGQVEEIDFGDLRLSAPGLITARAVDTQGQPLVDWWVRLYGGNSDHLHFTEGRREIAPRSNLHEARTDDRGRFAIGDLANGPYLVNVSIKGSTAFIERELILQEGASLDAGDLVIDLGLSIQGVVVDERDEPVANASVVVFRMPDEFSRVTYALTDTHGRFVVRGLAEGPYDLVVELGLASSEIRDAYAKDVLRGVRAGSSDVRLMLTRAAWVRGLVLDRDGKPAVDVYVDAIEMPATSDGMNEEQGRTDADGRFRLKVRGGRSYAVRAIDLSSLDADARAHAVAEARNVTPAREELVLRLAEPR